MSTVICPKCNSAITDADWRTGNHDMEDGDLIHSDCHTQGDTMENEKVNHPAHYGGDTTYEAIKVIKAWGLGFCLGNVVKYICRSMHHSMQSDEPRTPKILKDLRKARWYLDHKIQELEEATRAVPDNPLNAPGLAEMFDPSLRSGDKKS